MGKEKTWMTAKEYAETHDLPVSTIRRYCRAGEIPALGLASGSCSTPKTWTPSLSGRHARG